MTVNNKIPSDTIVAQWTMDQQEPTKLCSGEACLSVSYCNTYSLWMTDSDTPLVFIEDCIKLLHSSPCNSQPVACCILHTLKTNYLNLLVQCVNVCQCGLWGYGTLQLSSGKGRRTRRAGLWDLRAIHLPSAGQCQQLPATFKICVFLSLE